MIPAEELAVMGKDCFKELIPFHCMFFPSKAVLYSRWRDDDQEFAEVLPDGRTYYHLKSSEDFVEMCRREDAFILMPHPGTKTNDGLPYDCKDKAWFTDERWFGIGCRQFPERAGYLHQGGGAGGGLGDLQLESSDIGDGKAPAIV